MKKSMHHFMAAFVALAYAVSVQAAHKAADFKVRLVGVGVASAADSEFNKAQMSPEKRVVVSPGNLAVFHLEYDFPTDVMSRLYLSPNFVDGDLDENPFGTSGSGLLSGKGSLTRVVILGAGGDEPYERNLLLKSVRVEGEIESDGDAPRNSSFFIRDFPVDVLFANNGDAAAAAKALAPKPSPAFDPTLGIVKREKAERSKSSTPPGFTDNLDAALAKAKTEGKLVYACFSGSDWCGWCMKLEREVLSKGEFLAGVTNDFELVFVDSPRNKGVLSEHAKAENPALVKKYGIHGFPTALILDGNGGKVGETGYRKGGASAYVTHLMDFRKNGK